MAKRKPPAAMVQAANTLLSLRYAPPPDLARDDANQLALCTRLLAEATERVQQLRLASDAVAAENAAASAMTSSYSLHLLNLYAAHETESALRTSKLYIERLISARRAFL